MLLGTLSETLRMLISRVRQPSSDISEISQLELDRSISRHFANCPAAPLQWYIAATVPVSISSAKLQVK